MADKASKVWEPYSKMVRMQEEDWAVLESVYNDYRYRQGDLQRTEFIKRFVAKGVTSYLYQLKSRILSSRNPRHTDPGFRSIVLGSEFAIDHNPSYDESRDS